MPLLPGLSANVKENFIVKYRYPFVICIFFLSVGSFGVSAQTVTFNDANLAAEVRSRLGLGATDPITQTNILNLTVLAVSATAGVTDLTGLEYATNLEYLSFGSHGATYHNAVSDLSPLSELTSLETLDFTQNAVSDISALKKLTNLTSLQFGNHGADIPGKHNSVSDISALSGMTKLTTLIFSRNAVSDISALKNLTKLTRLDFGGISFDYSRHNSVSDISALKNLTALTYLDFTYNNVSSVSALSGLTSLTTLRFSYNDVSDISGLSRLTSLTTLEAAWNADPGDRWKLPTPPPAGLRGNLRNISGLSGLTSLTTLLLSRNSISDIKPLQGLANLEYLSLDTNQIVSIEPLRGLTNLTRLLLPYNEISDIEPLRGLTNLTVLYMWFNKISDLAPLSGLTNLRQLGLQCNSISDVESLRGLTALTYLGLSGGNSISDVEPLSGLTKLRTLVLDHTVDENEVTSELSELIASVLTIRFQELNCSVSPPSGGASRGTGDSGLSSPGQVSFSELMFTSKDETGSLPQWIEVYNASETETVNLRGWHLEIEGRDDNGEHQYTSIVLKDLIILPDQIGLIVTTAAPNSVDLPEGSICELLAHHPEAFRRNRGQNPEEVLGQRGFSLKLSNPDGGVSDVVGNLDGDKRTADAPTWELPAGRTDEGFRTSLLRQYDPQTDRPLDGRLLANYWRSVDVALEIGSYWGRYTDVGNPGYRDQGKPHPIPRRVSVSISELMFTSRGGLHSLPQWIELYNGSGTETVDLRDWKLRIESLDEKGERRFGVVTLGDFLIPPRQTALIVTERGRQSRQISRTPVYSLRARDVFKHRRHQVENRVFGQHGFFLKLSDPNGVVSDVVGNLDGQAATEDKPKWEMPSGETPRGFRTSLMRRYYRATGIPLDGKVRENWRRAVDLDLEVVTYWGRQTDIGTPGHIGSDRLPPGRVSFSELMFPVSSGFGSLPQWIELYNASETETVDLRDWELEIEGRDETGEHRYGVITLQSLQIPPRQTALLVTGWGANGGDISHTRIYNISRYHRHVFRQPFSGNRTQVLGETGFFLRLSNPDDGISDVVGNLDGDRLTTDAPIWELPPGEVDKGARTSSRTSLMRRYHEASMPLDGAMLANWVRAVDVDLKIVTYYGRTTDVGNPGYTNDERLSPRAPVSISELMLTSRGGLHSLPQWIEVYNASETEGVALRGWQLEVEGRDETGEHRFGVVTLGDLRIPPRQTALLVTQQGRHSEDILKDSVSYVYARDVFRNSGYQIRNRLLGDAGFFLKLSDAEGVVRDVVGNLDGVKTTSDEPIWELPSGKTAAGFRVSLMRRYYHVTGIPLDGRASANWVPASNFPLRVRTYWGRETDLSNPGYRGGGPLPVRLSHFRPERTNTGHVVIKWTTASEKDNAGFNILRSQQRRGGFVRLNSKLIPGSGTTSERHDYTWQDTTANHQVVYYYRLEDVSFSGERRQLGTVRLRGHVSAGGKLTTRWGNLKQEEYK
ncbi:hypothetical protein C6496_07550 [Candidatus Poribacteria bacterium]|nr:MAG: hypothetical protein C6496_07550 [Candidatus Poribacteria bacterium]